MENLYDQLVRLRAMPHAYEDWAAYRASLTDFILGNTEKGASAIILGAGPCNDLDLARLTAQFPSLTLCDIDVAAMRQGLARQGIGEDAVTLLEADLAGIPAGDYRELAEAVMSELQVGSPDGNAVTYMFYDAIEQALENLCPTPIPRDTYDYVICSGVHSQLLAPFAQMAAVFSRYCQLDLEGIFARVSGANGILTCAFNGLTLSVPRKGTILGLEQGRAGTEGGVEGAQQALENLADMGITPNSEVTLTWPFDTAQGKTYTMRVMAIPRG